MADNKVELAEGAFEAVAGGAGVYNDKRITTALSKCSQFQAGSNYWNQKVLGIGGTCGACSHFISESGWQLCDVPGNY